MSAGNRGSSRTRFVVSVGVLGALILSVSRLAVADGPVPEPVQTVVYGDAPSTFGRLHLPRFVDGETPVPVVVLLHGGFWRRRGGDLSLMEPLAVDLAARGYAVWNVEYGRTGERLGGWPHTFNHVAAAVDHLEVLAAGTPLDLESVAIVGHSAGGHLALWAAGRSGFATRSAWDPAVASRPPVVEPAAVIALAPIVDLIDAAAAGLGNGAVVDLVGGEPEVQRVRYAAAAPVPAAGVDVTVIVGGDDDTVPPRFSQPDWPGGDTASWVVVAGEDHLRLISPQSDAWADVVAALAAARS